VSALPGERAWRALFSQPPALATITMARDAHGGWHIELSWAIEGGNVERIAAWDTSLPRALHKLVERICP
jgi:hypothetical protein